MIAVWYMSSKRIVECTGFRYSILCLIVISSILVGVETYPSVVEKYGDQLKRIDSLILYLFVIEIIIKVHAERFIFFNNRWNVFDMLIVFAMCMPVQASYVSVFRLLRVLRIVRLFTHLSGMQKIVNSIVRSVKGVTNLAGVLAIFFYIFAILANQLFGRNDPIHFGNLQRSFVSLIRLATLDGWTELMTINVRGCNSYGYWEFPRYCVNSEAQPFVATVFFVLFVFLGGLVLFNFFVGVIIHSMDDTKQI